MILVALIFTAADFSQPIPSSVTLDSMTTASGECSTISITQDVIEEGTETFTVTLTPDVRAEVVEGRGTAQVLIVDLCNTLPAPENGNIDASVRTVGSVATYTCNSEFVINGESERNCQADGTWSGAAPTCLGNIATISYCWG